MVHINAGIAGLVGAYVIGKRIGYGKASMAPHSLTMTMIGASLLWVGWFGFNVGSNLEATGTAALAFVNTLRRHGRGALSLDVRRVDVQGQADDAGRRLRAPSPAWWPSRRPAASSVRWARSCIGLAGRPASACGRSTG